MRLHDFISGWFRGEISRDTFDASFTDALHPDFQNVQPSGTVLEKAALVEPIRDAYGTNPEFRITIETPHLITECPGHLLMGYVEFQQGARNSASENRRRSTVLFETAGGRLVWNGSASDLRRDVAAWTGLSGCDLESARRDSRQPVGSLHIRGARVHNLRDLLPLGCIDDNVIFMC